MVVATGLGPPEEIVTPPPNGKAVNLKSEEQTPAPFPQTSGALDT